MNRIVHTVLLAIILLTFKTGFAQKGELVPYQSYFSNQLSGWTKTIKGFTLSKFKKNDTLVFDGSDYLSISKLKDFYSIYKPILKYSPDSSQFIDIYSAELNLQRVYDRTISTPNVEQGISLCNPAARSWEKILWLGPDDGIEDVCWISNSEFILAGYSFDKERKRRPVIYMGSLVRNSFIMYIDDSQVSTGYQTPELKKMHIEQEQ
jgi:hypothetical protein